MGFDTRMPLDERVRERVFQLRDEFVRLYAEYKSLQGAADQDEESNPTDENGGDVSEHHRNNQTGKQLSSLVDHMLNIMIQVIEMVTNEDEARLERGCKGRTANAPQDREDEVPRKAPPQETGRKSNKAKTNRQKTRPPAGPRLNNGNVMHLLLIPPVQHNNPFPACRVKEEPMSEDSQQADDAQSQATRFIEKTQNWVNSPVGIPFPRPPSLYDLANSQKNDIFTFYTQHERHLSHELIVRLIQDKYPLKKQHIYYIIEKGKLGVVYNLGDNTVPPPQRQPDEDDQTAFLRETENWLGINRPAPHQCDSKAVTAQQKRDMYAFYVRYIDHFKRSLILERLMEKYYLNRDQVSSIILRGRGGDDFEPRYRTILARHPEAVDEVVAFAKANPDTFSVPDLAERCSISETSVIRILQHHGIKTVETPETGPDTQEGREKQLANRDDGSSSSGTEEQHSKGSSQSESGSSSDDSSQSGSGSSSGDSEPAKLERCRTMRSLTAQNEMKFRKFLNDTQDWMSFNRPAPPPPGRTHLTLQFLTPDQKRDAFKFYTTHKDRIPLYMISDRIEEKYHISKLTRRMLLQKGRAGETFEQVKGPKNGSRCNISEEAIREMAAAAKANPLTFSLVPYAAKFGCAQSTVCRIAKENGIKVFSNTEKRALRLNMEGKEYTPFAESPAVYKYHYERYKERKRRRQKGDMTDGRSARHKDPNWKDLRKEVGVPEGVVLYGKEWRQEFKKKKSLLRSLDPEVRDLVEPTLRVGRCQKQTKEPPKTKKSSKKPARSQNTSTDTSNASHSQDAGYNQISAISSHSHPPAPEPVVTGWSTQFDPHSGSLIHSSAQGFQTHETRSRSSLAIAAATACHLQNLQTDNGTPALAPFCAPDHYSPYFSSFHHQ